MERKFPAFTRNILLGAVAASSLTGQSALAQEASMALEEVVVTARKRAESIQDVPVAVTALSAGQIQRGIINSVVDLKKLAPNVELIAQPFAGAALSASIRGVGLDDLEKTFEPTVGVSIDGVFLASTAGANVDLFDIESVEVLRGPQGTLFGRNTVGGVININRTKPTKEFGIKLQATFDEFNRQDFQAMVNIPIGERGGIKIAGRNLQSDAFTDNVTRGENPDNRDLQNATVSVLYDFTDNFSAQFTWDNYNDNTRLVDQINITSIPYNGFGFLGPGYQDVTSGDLSAATDYSTTYSGGKFYSTIQGNNYALTLNGSVGNHDLKFITSKMETKERMDICSWGAPIDSEYAASNFVLFPFGTGTADNPSNQPCFFPVLREQEFEQATSEFTVTSNFDGPLNYVAGLYYMTSDAPFDSGPVQVIQSLQELEARAIYGELIWSITDNWGLTAGARYTDEEKDFSVTAGAFPNGQDFFFEDDEITYRLVLERKFDFGMIYASYSTGFRSGGFNSRGTTPNTVGPYESESVDSIEIGLRSQFLDDRVTLNLTYFDATYEDKQEAVVTAGDGSFIFNGQPEDCGGPTCTFIFNAGEVDNSGIEIEAMALVTDGLTLRAAIGTLDSEYAKFDYAGVDIADIANVTWAPELTAAVGAEWLLNIGAGQLALNANFKYTDEAWGRTDWTTYDPATGPDMLVDSFEVLDLSATYTHDLGRGMLTVRVYGTDVLEDGGRIARPFDAGAFAFADIVPRRTLGATIGYEF